MICDDNRMTTTYLMRRKLGIPQRNVWDFCFEVARMRPAAD